MPIFSKKISDSDIINGIFNGGNERRNAEYKLYNKYNYFIGGATFKHKIDAENASMAYSDAVLTVIEHIVSNRFEGRAELKTYIFQIFNNKCVDALRRLATKEKYMAPIDDILYQLPDAQKNIVADLIQNQDFEQLKQKLSKMGERCQDLLNRWAIGYSDKELALEYGYNTSSVVQTTRLRCLDKLREMYHIK